MKKILILLIVIQSVSGRLIAQNDLAISKHHIIGVWQINSPSVGNGYAECFSFFPDGTFVYQYDPSDDTRNIIGLKGKYRLEKTGLYLTILSRTQRIGGKIQTGATGTDDYLFVFDNDKMKQVAEVAPKELEPLIISDVHTIAGRIDFNINNRHYYKVATDPNKIKDQ